MNRFSVNCALAFSSQAVRKMDRRSLGDLSYMLLTLLYSYSRLVNGAGFSTLWLLGSVIFKENKLYLQNTFEILKSPKQLETCLNLDGCLCHRVLDLNSNIFCKNLGMCLCRKSWLFVFQKLQKRQFHRTIWNLHLLKRIFCDRRSIHKSFKLRMSVKSQWIC